LLLGLLLSVSAYAGEPLAKTYPGPWHREFNVSIVRTLNDHRVKNCGDLAWRPNPKQHHEFLVYCSADMGVWRVYLVWPAFDKIMGPYPVDPSLPAPKPIVDLRPR